MKKLAFSLLTCLTIATSAFAGSDSKQYTDMKQSKDYAPPAVPCFQNRELQLDAFGSYTNSHENTLRPGDQDGFGGGLALNYFFIRNVGIGLDGNVFDADVNGLWDVTTRLIFRFPIESLCLAPYAFGGGGWEVDGESNGTLHAGGGLEFRATPKLGFFGEGRYTWTGFFADGHNLDAVQIRAGIRLVF